MQSGICSNAIVPINEPQAKAEAEALEIMAKSKKGLQKVLILDPSCSFRRVHSSALANVRATVIFSIVDASDLLNFDGLGLGLRFRCVRTIFCFHCDDFL